MTAQQRSILSAALIQLRPEKGQVEHNLARVRQAVAHEASRGTRLAVFPETALSGYFVEGGVAEVSRSPEDVAAGLGAPPPGAPDVILGTYETGHEGIHNSAVYLAPDGDRWTVVHRHRKVFLPTYGVFQEARFVSPGTVLRAFDTRFGRVGLMICEEMMHSMVPSVLALDGAEFLVCLAATPSRDYGPAGGLPGNLERWDVTGRAIALEHGLPLLVCHLVGSEGGKLFAGGSVAYGSHGEILGRAELFREDRLEVTLDPGEGRRARTASPLLSDLRVALPHLLTAAEAASLRVEDRPGVAAGEVGRPLGQPAGDEPGGARTRKTEKGEAAGTEARAAGASGPPADIDPTDDSVLELDLELVERALVRFLEEEIRERRGFESVVLGVSGGVDSAVALFLAVKALGAENVHAFLLPYATSSPESRDHAERVLDAVGVPGRTISITGGVDAYVEAFEPEISDLRRGNLAARFRSMVLWDQSAALEALPLGTGNKSERLLGYYTWHADDAPPVNPLGDLFKTQVWALARHLDVPAEVRQKAPSADLVRGVDDEDELGVGYEVADLILHWLLVGRTPEDLIQAGFSENNVQRVHHLLEGTHWKRHLPTVAILSSTAIGEFYLRPVDY